MTLNTPRKAIVFGDLQLASSIATYLRDLHLAIDAVTDGDNALQLWLSGDYALVLCLCPVALAPALQLASSIRDAEAADEHVPIIAMLGSGLAQESSRCLQAGMDDTVGMPVDGDSLRTKVEEWLEAVPAERDVIWDAGALARLMGPSPSTHARLIARFLQSASSQLDELIALCACGDEAGIRDLLHKLKSAARTVGAFDLAFQCHAVEQTHHLNQSIVACEALKKLNLAWDRVLPYLAPYEQPQ